MTNQIKDQNRYTLITCPRTAFFMLQKVPQKLNPHPILLTKLSIKLNSTTSVPKIKNVQNEDLKIISFLQEKNSNFFHKLKKKTYGYLVNCRKKFEFFLENLYYF